MICKTKNMEEFRDRNRKSVIEAVNWSCCRELPNREWVTEFACRMHEYDILERKKFDIGVPCV